MRCIYRNKQVRPNNLYFKLLHKLKWVDKSFKCCCRKWCTTDSIYIEIFCLLSDYFCWKFFYKGILIISWALFLCFWRCTRSSDNPTFYWNRELDFDHAFWSSWIIWKCFCTSNNTCLSSSWCNYLWWLSFSRNSTAWDCTAWSCRNIWFFSTRKSTCRKCRERKNSYRNKDIMFIHKNKIKEIGMRWV